MKILVISLFITFLIFLGIVFVSYYFKSEELIELVDIDEATELKMQNQEALEKARQAQISLVTAIDESDHVWGELEAEVQLIVYNDFTCPYSADFHDTVKTIKEHFGDQVVVAFRYYLAEIRHDKAWEAALAAECAAEQGQFWQMADELFAMNTSETMTKDYYYQAAEELDLNKIEFKECLEAEKYKDKIQKQKQAGDKAGIGGTPVIFVNQEILPGAVQFEDFIDSQDRKREGMRSIIERYLD